MKNTLTLLLLLFSISAQSQSTRLVLLEEFTQASCGPCAEQNPAMNALLNRHPDKAVSIKYHTYFPGYDPMNDDNPDQVDTRYDYYGLFGVPHIKLDGGVALSGQPNELDSLDLVNRHAVPSPFTIDVAFALSPDGDSIFCNAQIVCTQAVSGNLVAHVVVIERDVYFEESPGSNDEVHFEGLMKQMLPSDLGTPLASNWTPGDQLDLSYAWKLENVYDNKQLACVVFIQNESTREVLQAGYRQPDLANDAGLWHTNGVPGLQCTSALSPVINVRNHGYDALTALDIEYWLNGVLQQTFPWTGNIPAGLNQDIALPTLAPPDGGNVIAFTARNPNGEPDPIADNDTAFAPVVIYTTTYPLPLMETFASAVFPPSNIGPYNPDNDGSKWVHANVGNGDAGSAKLTTYDSEYGRHDYLYLPMFDF
ncbi:MAG TPA: hypothetical protein VEY71_03605, partial [Chitinophagales bacterium]|nr:hypothetical protein [Chitinophagales bacterium]